MESFMNQLKQVLRRLARTPMFTVITLITLAAGVTDMRLPRDVVTETRSLDLFGAIGECNATDRIFRLATALARC